MGLQVTESLAEQIAQHLAKLIISGSMPPQTRIQELKVAAELAVGRGSVREALLLLEKRQLIDIYPRKGAVVSTLDSHKVVALYDIYATLLVMLAGRLAENWQGDDLQPMQAQVDQIYAISPDSLDAFDKLLEAACQLMQLAIATVNNPYLEQVLLNLWPAVSRTYYLAMQTHRHEFMAAMNFYGELMKAIRERDPLAAKAVIEGFAKHQQVLLTRVPDNSASSADQCA